MTIKELAARHHLSTRQDADGTTIIPGRTGHVFEYSESEMGVLFQPAEYKRRPWSSVRKKCLAGGMTLRQDADAEGTFSFDPEDPVQLSLAIKVAGAKRKRQLSAAQKQELISRLRKTTHQASEMPLRDGTSAPGTRPDHQDQGKGHPPIPSVDLPPETRL